MAVPYDVAAMPEEMEVLTGRARAAAAIVIALIVASGIFLRFYAHSALWLDEALTVDRSSLPVRDIATSLKQDGAPPLYYYLLHYWMDVFGQSDLATRSLSGVIGVATLPVAWLAANRFAGRIAAWVTLVLLASAPYAVYYSTEARMYSLEILLTGCGYLALSRALARPRPGNLIAIGVVTAALLYTQYWSLYLVATVGIWLLGSAWWDRRSERGCRGLPPLARLLRSGRRLPVVRAVAADVLLPVAAHRHPLGQAAELRRHRLRGHRVRRQPGLPGGGHDAGAPPRGHLSGDVRPRHLRHRKEQDTASTSTCTPGRGRAAWRSP